MLALLRRKKVMKRLLWLLAIIIIPAFVLWGAGSLANKKSPFKYIGTIEGKKITVDEFIKSSRDVQIGLFLNYFNQPQALDKLQEDRPLLNRLAWENLLLKKVTQKSGIKVSDEEVVDFITRHPLFLRGGVFDEKLYGYILKNSLGTTPRAFEENVRDYLISGAFRETIIKNVAVSDGELLRSYKNEFEKAKVRYVIINDADFKESADVSEREIDVFYEKNKDRFEDPEKVILQYIAFPHKEKGQKGKALDDLRDAYEKLKRHTRDMEKAAKRYSLHVEETKPFSQDSVVPEITGIRDINVFPFRLEPVIDIIPAVTDDEIGISYIVRVKEKLPSRIKEKDEVTGYIASALKDEKAADLAEKKTIDISEEARTYEMSLKEVAKKHNLQSQETELISRFDYVGGAGESYKIVDTAFALKVGDISKPVEVRKGFAIIEPVDFLFIDEEKFESDKDVYKNKILAVKKMKALQSWLAKISAASSLNVRLDRI